MFKLHFHSILAGLGLAMSLSTIAFAQKPGGDLMQKVLSQPVLRKAPESPMLTFESGSTAAAQFSALQDGEVAGKPGDKQASMITGDRMIPLLLNGVGDESHAFAAIIDVYNNSDYTQDVQVEFFNPKGAYQAVALSDSEGRFLGRYQAARITVPANGRRLFITYPEGEELQMGYARLRRSRSATTVETVLHQMFVRTDGEQEPQVSMSNAVADGPAIVGLKFLVANEEGSELALTLTDSSTTADVYTHVRARDDDGKIVCDGIFNTYNDSQVFVTFKEDNCFASLKGPFVLELESTRAGLHATALYGTQTGDIRFLPAIPGNN